MKYARLGPVFLPSARYDTAEVTTNRSCWQSVSLMLLIALVVAVVSLVIGGFMYRFPSRSGNWSNIWVENRLPGTPCFFVGAYHIHGWEPTVGYFVRYDRIEDSQTNPPTKWLEDRVGGRVFVNGREVFHRPGTFQLFVDDGRGQPVRIILDRADARHYFGSDNVVFVNYEGFADFWDDVLMTKYR